MVTLTHTNLTTSETGDNDKSIADRLCLHCGAAVVPDAFFRAAPTPDPHPAEKPTTFPVPHSLVRDTVVDGLERQGCRVVAEANALWPMLNDAQLALEPDNPIIGRDWGKRCFGLLLLEVPGQKEDADWRFVLGYRNAHDHSFSAQGILGTMWPFICDNLCFSGGNILSFARKHTRFIERDFEGVVLNEMGKLVDNQRVIEQRYDAYADWSFQSPEQVHDFVIRAFDGKAISNANIRKVLHEWRREDGCGGHDKPGFNDQSAMRMMNCFTEVEKQRPSLLEGPRRNNRLCALLDQQVGLQFSDLVVAGPDDIE